MKNLILSIVAIATLTTASFAEYPCNEINNQKGYPFSKDENFNKGISAEIVGSAKAFDQKSGGLSSSASQIFGDVGVSKKINTVQVFKNYENLWVYAKNHNDYKKFIRNFQFITTANYPSEKAVKELRASRLRFIDNSQYSEEEKTNFKKRELLIQNTKEEDTNFKVDTVWLFLVDSYLKKFNNAETINFFDIVVLNKTEKFSNEGLRKNKTLNTFLGNIIEGRTQEAYEIIMNLESSEEYLMTIRSWKNECNF